jgi:hypothetical protein
VVAYAVAFPTGSLASTLSCTTRVRFAGRTSSENETLPELVAPLFAASQSFGRRGSTIASEYETVPPAASFSVNTSRRRYAPFGRRSFRAFLFDAATVGGAASRSATPFQVLRNVIEAGSIGLPPRRTLDQVPLPRTSASGPLPSTICQVPLPPCSAGSRPTRAVKAPRESAQVNVRSAVSEAESMPVSTAYPDGQNEADVVNGPS